MHNTVLHLIYGDIAQLGEHRVRNAGVTGSNPAISTMNTEPGAKAPGFFWLWDVERDSRPRGVP